MGPPNVRSGEGSVVDRRRSETTRCGSIARAGGSASTVSTASCAMPWGSGRCSVSSNLDLLERQNRPTPVSRPAENQSMESRSNPHWTSAPRKTAPSHRVLGPNGSRRLGPRSPGQQTRQAAPTGVRPATSSPAGEASPERLRTKRSQCGLTGRVRSRPLSPSRLEESRGPAGRAKRRGGDWRESPRPRPRRRRREWPVPRR